MWWVIVEEQSGGGEGRTWNVSTTKPAGSDRATAEEIACRVAFQHTPQHPWSQKSRRVLRTAEGYLVIVTGRTANFHFRVTIGETVEKPAPVEN